jgi:hypothetical protein
MASDFATAFTAITGIAWTSTMETYFLPVAEAAVERDLSGAPDSIQILGKAYYIASLNSTTSGTAMKVTSESLGGYSYTGGIVSGSALDGWMDRYEALVDEYDTEKLSGAFAGVCLEEVPMRLRLDRRC